MLLGVAPGGRGLLAPILTPLLERTRIAKMPASYAVRRVRSDRTPSAAYMVKTSSGISPVPALARASHDTRAAPIASEKSLQSALMRYTIAMTVANVAQIDSIRLK